MFGLIPITIIALLISLEVFCSSEVVEIEATLEAPGVQSRALNDTEFDHLATEDFDHLGTEKHSILRSCFNTTPCMVWAEFRQNGGKAEFSMKPADEAPCAFQKGFCPSVESGHILELKIKGSSKKINYFGYYHPNISDDDHIVVFANWRPKGHSINIMDLIKADARYHQGDPNSSVSNNGPAAFVNIFCRNCSLRTVFFRKKSEGSFVSDQHTIGSLKAAAAAVDKNADKSKNDNNQDDFDDDDDDDEDVDGDNDSEETEKENDASESPTKVANPNGEALETPNGGSSNSSEDEKEPDKGAEKQPPRSATKGSTINPNKKSTSASDGAAETGKGENKQTEESFGTGRILGVVLGTVGGISVGLTGLGYVAVSRNKSAKSNAKSDQNLFEDGPKREPTDKEVVADLPSH